MLKSLLTLSAVALLVSPAFAASTTYDFETDQSASFTSVEFGGPDSTTNYQYDYSGDGIGTAPSGSGQTGLQTQVNLSSAAGNSLTFFPDTTGLAVNDGDWQLTFDVYSTIGDDINSSTEFFGFGAADTTSQPAVGADGTNGFNYIVTVDGGSANDYRYAYGTSTPLTIDNTVPNWWGTGEVNGSGTNWTSFFPSPPYYTAGSPAGEEWVTVRLTVTNGGADREVAFKKPTDGSFTVASTITGGTGSSANPAFGHADYFTSVQTNQWVIFDNIVIDDTPATSVQDWTLY